MRRSVSLMAFGSLVMPLAAHAQITDSFSLGQITVVGHPADEALIGNSALGQDAIRIFNRQTLDDAVSLVPGVTASNSGGSRNERLIFVRGFDRFQVPLAIDGIRVYLPADNRLDFGRFLTADVSEIQVAKGYASVLDGPGAMGGAINLVTRKPTKAIEAEVGATLNLDHDVNYVGYNVFGLIGTRHDQWYAQASYTRNFRDHSDLASGFRPTVNENGSPRDYSKTEDWRLNLKLGFTPNATDEYSLSYTRQEGARNAPLHITDRSNVSLRNWSWPEWNIDSVYFLSTTALGDKAVVKTRLYYNEFYNLLKSWDNGAQNSQRLARSFDSPYNDNAYGGSVQVDAGLTGHDTLSVAVHYRRDEHNEQQAGAPESASPTREPNQRNVENTYTVALENRLSLTDTLKFTVGASYDWRDTARAEEYDSRRVAPLTPLFSFPLINADGWNGQGRLDWTGDHGSSAYASISSRVRFPTIFERFSSQFNNADPNPYLKPERATNFEIGGARQFGPVRATAAIFYSHLTDALVTIRTNAGLNRRENIGSADYYGGEVSLDAQLLANLRMGANYSYIHRDFNVGSAPIGGFIRQFQLTDVPDHKGFAYLSWRPFTKLEIVPSVEMASSRTTVTVATANADVPVYYPTGAYANGAIRVDYEIMPQVTLGIGARNLFDQNVILTDGFPEQGRSFYASLRARY